MSKIAELKCVIADVCLADYWSGHHLPHVAVPVTHETTLAELKDGILQELYQDAIAGSEYNEDDESWHKAAEKAAIAWYTETIKVNDQWESEYIQKYVNDLDFQLSYEEWAGTKVLFPELKDDMLEYDEDCDEWEQELPLAWVVFVEK